ncbi:endonuclease domain-containing protein [Spirilliplanes yamanashiensis]|uniref:DUF559 domain-containing protein n=1 Tax=Spirilliplanes yamanashiensis TaxID=42233 RepID=A0A8J4DJ92_9ACTN|nr:hypothetical protein [Spirilliplanes yamanashiensis]MDP9815106.1 hypothetical protein [Spirilliplanes yamanashiensis]GIJ02760.1 hypothetical protein Sya03_21120 [Spirilliplanes yamanashiensis]
MDTHTFLRSVAHRQDGVVTHGQALAAGVPEHEIGTLCLTGRWVPLAELVYSVDRSVVVSRRARVRAAVLSLGPGAVAVLETAAELHGMAGPQVTDTIYVAVRSATGSRGRRGMPPGRLPMGGHAAAPAPHAGPPGPRSADPAGLRPATRNGGTSPRPHRPGPASRVLAPAVGGARLQVMRGPIAPHEVHAVAGIAVTSPVRTAADLLLRLPRYPAVAMLDDGLHRGLLTAEALAGVPAMITGRTGAPAARRHIAEADGRAQSPLETRVRLRCADGGLVPDELQHVVREPDGHILAVADLAWLRAGVLAEADGIGPHEGPDAVYSDRWRQNSLANAGWRVLRFTWTDTLRADYIPSQVRAALSCPVGPITAAGR